MNKYQELKEHLKNGPKTWLVTGAAGFIGSHLVEQLLLLDQVVTGLDNFSTGKKKNLDYIRESVSAEQWDRLSMVEGDIVDFPTCTRVVKDMDYVLHQAALGSVPRSLEKPLDTNAANITGFINMLEASRAEGVKKFVYAASSSTYGDHPGLPKIESVIGNPLSPYAVTKLVDELYAAVFQRCYGIETVGLRYFNVFGPRQDPNGAYAAVIPKWIGSILGQEAVYINGDGETSRDFCYVANAVQANLLAATSQLTAPGPVYNVALGDRTSLNQLFRKIKGRLSEKNPALGKAEADYRDFRAGDVRHSMADISKIQNELGYEADFKVDSGLDETVDWFWNTHNSPDQS